MTPRIVAIVPAAGHSRRMGQPKLLLKLGEKTVIARVVEALHSAGIEKVLVVARSDDPLLAEEVRQTTAELVVPEIDPPDMRASVELALRSLGQVAEEWDGWMLIPADHPTLETQVIEQLIAAWDSDRTRIAVPTWQGRRGHPTLFPWVTANEVSLLPPDSGLNVLLRSRPDRVLEVAARSDQVLIDLDTPDDWERIQKNWNER
jgi:molybdenum cofactor cytidylyltransferase